MYKFLVNFIVDYILLRTSYHHKTEPFENNLSQRFYVEDDTNNIEICSLKAKH